VSPIHWVARGTGTPKDKDEVNRREVCECDGCVCHLDVMGTPSRLRLIRKVETLPRVRPTLFLNCQEKTARRKCRTNSLYSLPDVLATTGIK
jgi:hypothetical protein